MYKCEELIIGDGVVKASYGIEYVGVRAFMEDQKCKVHCTLIDTCNILKAFDKFKLTKEKAKEREILRKQLKVV